MKKNLLYLNLFIMFLLVCNVGVIHADESSKLKFYGEIVAKHDFYEDDYRINLDDFTVDGIFYYDGQEVSLDKITIFKPTLQNDSIILSLKATGYDDYLDYTVKAKFVPFSSEVYISNKDSVINTSNFWVDFEISNGNKNKNGSNITFTNSIGKIVNGVLRFTSSEKMHYGYNKMSYTFTPDYDSYQSKKGTLTVNYEPYDIKMSSGKNKITITKSKYLEYSLDKKTWQDGNVFKNLKANTQYKIYIRTKKTDDYKSGTVVAKTIKTKK